MEFIKVDEPFEKIGLDVLGPFPESDAGNRNVFVAIDYLTKWAKTRASPTQTAEDATAFLLQCIIVSRMDPCEQPPGPDGNEEADADEEEPSQPSQKRVRFM